MADLIMSQLISQADRDKFERSVSEQIFESSYSVAPTARSLVALNSPLPELVRPRWGFRRQWARGPLINATAEKLNDARTWKIPFRNSRCIVPVSGYYEWVNRRPFYITNDSPLFACGLWEERECDRFFTIVTTSGVDSAGEVHDRMPLFLSDELVEDWLNPGGLSMNEATELIAVVTSSAMEIAREIKAWEVSTRINNVRTAVRSDSSLITPV